MSLETVIQYFDSQGLKDRVKVFEQSSATVELAALAVGCEPAHIAKTMSFLLEDHPILIVTAGDARVDNSKFKKLFHTKAKMPTQEEVAALTGHAVGGVCPFANPDGVDTYLDISLQRFETVFPAAGSSNSAIELTCEELERYSNCKAWIDVCKNWQEDT